MDPLSDLLRAVRLDGAYFYPVEAAGVWSVESPRAKELTPRILPTSEHLIPYHILVEGQCWGGLVAEEQIGLAAGDAILFPQGDAHVMSSDRGVRRGLQLETAPGRYPDTVRVGSEGPRTATFICGYLGCDRRPFNPLLAALPRRMHMRGISNPWIQAITRQLTEESRLGRAGAEEVATRLAELMFIEALRRYLDEMPAGQTGWLAGLRDETVSKALALIHGQPGRPWTLVDLARETATSRSQLAKRFASVVGQPPMQYLTQWRMQVAASRLLQTTDKIATIGAGVGYDSEAAFSRAFKQATGLAPGAWRDARRSAA